MTIGMEKGRLQAWLPPVFGPGIVTCEERRTELIGLARQGGVQGSINYVAQSLQHLYKEMIAKYRRLYDTSAGPGQQSLMKGGQFKLVG